MIGPQLTRINLEVVLGDTRDYGAGTPGECKDMTKFLKSLLLLRFLMGFSRQRS